MLEKILKLGEEEEEEPEIEMENIEAPLDASEMQEAFAAMEALKTQGFIVEEI